MNDNVFSQQQQSNSQSVTTDTQLTVTVVGLSNTAPDVGLLNTDSSNKDEELRKLLKPTPTENDIMNILRQYYSRSNDNNNSNGNTVDKDDIYDDIKIIQQLDSYDDCNYQIMIQDQYYLLKITNGIESNDYCLNYTNYSSIIQLQHSMMNILHTNHIGTTIPVQPTKRHNSSNRNDETNNNTVVDKEYVVLHKLPVLSKAHSPYLLAIRLYHWVDGIPMSITQNISIELFIHIGQKLGTINHIFDQLSISDTVTGTCTDTTSSINHKNIFIPARRYHQWDGKNTYDLYKYTEYIQSIERRLMIQSILDTFHRTILIPQKDKLFRAGIIMGDYNDANIILSTNNNDHTLQFTGVIDFGDSVESWRVLDVTIAMAYAMLSSYGKRHRSMSAAAALLRGYHSVYPLLDIEREHLVLFIVCRLACSVTLGAYSLQQNPENKYLLLHSEPAWKALELLWGYEDGSYRKRMTDTLNEVFHKACFYTTTTSPQEDTDEIPCYDLAFPDPNVVDPFANIRVDGNQVKL